MSDLLAGLGSVLLDGPILALLLVVYSIVLGGTCYWAGRLRQVREQKRQVVRDAVEVETAARLGELVPSQRPESD